MGIELGLQGARNWSISGYSIGVLVLCVRILVATESFLFIMR